MHRTVDIFKALADETRLRIVQLLLHGGQPLCVCEIVDTLRLPQYQISRHLTVLKNAGLVTVKRKGTWAYHRLADEEPVARELWQLLARHSQDEKSRRDAANLDLRLSLRSGGECVIGFVAAAERNASAPAGGASHD